MLLYFGLFTVAIVLSIQIALMVKALFTFDDSPVDNGFKPFVSIVIPAYNEEKSIISSVKSALAQDYENFEVIVVNDGSEDETLKKLSNFKQIYRLDDLHIAHKQNGGKFSALNLGMDYAQGDWILAVDADSFLLPETISTLVAKKKEGSVAMTASVGMINGCEIENGQMTDKRVSGNLLVISQMIEYMRTFVMLKMSLNSNNGVGIISGACGFFDKDFVQGIGGYREDITEDAELTLRIHNNGGIVQYISDVLSYTEAPSSVSVLHKQRMRWIRGLLRNMNEYRKLESTKSIKWFLMPYFYITDYALPWIEFFGWSILIGMAIFGNVSFGFIAASMGAFYLLYLINTATLFAVTATKMEKSMDYRGKFKVVFASLFDFLYYRPLILFFVLKAQLMELFGSRVQWGSMDRKGF